MARIFITGSADGLGRAAAATLLDAGHELVVHARSDFADAVPIPAGDHRPFVEHENLPSLPGRGTTPRLDLSPNPTGQTPSRQVSTRSTPTPNFSLEP